MERLAEFRPHLGGAVWRGTATRQSAVHIDLYCDDRQGGGAGRCSNAGRGPRRRHALDAGHGGQARDVLSGVQRLSRALGERVTVHLFVRRPRRPARGALKPDARRPQLAGRPGGAAAPAARGGGMNRRTAVIVGTAWRGWPPGRAARLLRRDGGPARRPGRPGGQRRPRRGSRAVGLAGATARRRRTRPGRPARPAAGRQLRPPGARPA
jgi:hypothetical protein